MPIIDVFDDFAEGVTDVLGTGKIFFATFYTTLVFERFSGVVANPCQPALACVIQRVRLGEEYNTSSNGKEK